MARWLMMAGVALVLLTLAGAAVHLPGAEDEGSFARQGLFVVFGVAATAAYFAAVALVVRGGAGRRAVWLVLGVALAMRAVALASPAFLSSDLYRYIWDGRVQLAGHNPYRYLPTDPALAALRDTLVYPHINRAEYAPTIYPPTAELWFRAVASVAQTPLAIKAAMLGCDLLAIGVMLRLLALAGQDRARALIYAWNPLTAWEFAGNAHVDALAVGLIALTLLAAARGRRGLTGVLFGAAVLVKFLPAALFPALWRRWDWKLPLATAATLVVLYLPFIGAGRHVLGFLPGYAAEEGLDSGTGIYWLDAIARLLPLPAAAGRAWLLLAALMLAALAGWMMFWRQRPRENVIAVARDCCVLATAAMAALTPHYPWYFVWLSLPSCLAAYPSVVWLSAAAIVQYHDPFGDRVLQFSFIWLPFMALAGRDLWRRRALPMTPPVVPIRSC